MLQVKLYIFRHDTQCLVRNLTWRKLRCVCISMCVSKVYVLVEQYLILHYIYETNKQKIKDIFDIPIINFGHFAF